MRLDICIPAHNEATIIAESVRAVREAFKDVSDTTVRIVVADNASTDGTGDTIRSLGFPDVMVIDVPEKGKGAAVVAAARQSDADMFGYLDADLSADPMHFKELLATHLSEGSHIVIGSRLHPDARIDRGFARTASSKVFNAIRRAMVGVSVRDSQCGIKLTGRKGLEHLRACIETGWFFEVEWLRRAELAGLSIVEVPITWQEFRYKGRASKLKVVEDGLAAIAAFKRINQRLR